MRRGNRSITPEIADHVALAGPDQLVSLQREFTVRSPVLLVLRAARTHAPAIGTAFEIIEFADASGR